MKIDLSLHQIGIVHTPYKDVSSVPHKPEASSENCSVEVFEEYEAGLFHIEDFSHIYLLSWLHLMKNPLLRVVPHHEIQEHGVFATRTPRRPTPIALSLVKLIKCKGRFLDIAGCDLLDGTPLLDIKPYRPDGIKEEECRCGWFEVKAK